MLASGCSRQRIEALVSRTPEVPAAAGRYQRVLPKGANDYARDAAYLADLLEAYYPDKAGDQLGADFEERSEGFIEDAGRIQSDFDWRVRLQVYLAALRDGHTSVSVPLYEEGEPFYSARIFLSDSLTWRLAAVDSTLDQGAVGARVVGVNGFDLAQVDSAVRRYHSGENPYYKRYLLSRFYPLPQYWQALGLAKSGDPTLRLSVIDSTGRRRELALRQNDTYRAKSIPRASARYPFAVQQARGFFTQYLPDFGAAYLQMNTTLDWAAMRPELGHYIPFPLSLPAKAYMRSRNKKAGTLDFGRTLATFFRKVHADGIDTVIVDLRYNPGGDERLGRQLIYYLTDREDLRQGETYYQFNELFRTVVPGDYNRYRKAYAKTYGGPPDDTSWIAANAEIHRQDFWQGIRDEDSPLFVDPTVPKFDGEVFVLTGPQTFSAASILASTLQDNDLATLVGTPTGNRPSGPTGAAGVKLPHTRTMIRLSYLYMDRADPTKMHLDATYPDLYAPQTWEDLRAGVDTAVEAVLGAPEPLD